MVFELFECCCADVWLQMVTHAVRQARTRAIAVEACEIECYELFVFHACFAGNHADRCN